jgi:putative transcriptional regulator
LRDSLLIASPRLGDPNFERTVVLLLEHGDDGALGVVLNRPTLSPVREILEPWAEPAERVPPGLVFAGGPVSLNAVIGLARMGEVPVEPEETLPDWVAPSDGEVTDPAHVPRGRWVNGLITTVDLSVPPEEQPAGVEEVRLFAGYAGWTSGQLEEELGEGAWYVVDPSTEDIFGSNPDQLWHDVLRRQGGQLALLAGYPPHPSVN